MFGKCSNTVPPLSFAVAKAQMLCYQLFVGLNCTVVVFGGPCCSVGAEEGVMVHTRPPEILTVFGRGQSQRHLTVLGLPLEQGKLQVLCRTYLWCIFN